MNIQHCRRLNAFKKVGAYLICLVFTTLIPLSLWAQSNTGIPKALQKPDHPIQVIDIYHQAMAIKQLFNQFMFAMGKKKKVHPKLIVENAQSRDVLFQAISIYNKATRLSFQYTRRTYPQISKADESQNNLDNIWDILHETLVILYQLQPVLDRQQPLVVTTPEKPVSLTDVSTLLIEFNQRIDDMGWVQASPSETFGVLTKAIYLAAALIAESPLPQTIPEPPAYIRGKTPAQVYRRLLAIMALLNQISERQHIPSIRIRVEDFKAENVYPSDVNDMTHFIIARLETFYSIIKPDAREIEVYYHGWKLPSHIFQRAGILKIQVQHLFDTVQQYPAWLKGDAQHE